MSGHSKWATIRRQKGAKDAARGAVFTKLGNNIAIAARGGADPETNFTLRLAIDKARAANMPNANIQRSIDRGSGKLGGAVIEEVTYEGYGPGGVAVIVECATDNKNRTYPEVRLAITKNGGSMAEQGSVTFQFQRRGYIRATFEGTADDALLTAIDAGADDIEATNDGAYEVFTYAKALGNVRDALGRNGFTVTEAELTYLPNTTIEITNAETERKVMNMMNALDDLDDVVNVHANFTVAES